MKISVDVQPLLSGNKTGIGFYETEVLNALSELDNNNEYYLNFFSLRNTRSKIECAEKLFGGKGKIQICKWASYSVVKKLWYLFPVPYKCFFREETDVSLFFNYYVPPFTYGKTITVIHDMTVKDMPETMSTKTRFALSHTLKQSIKRADKIVTVSEFSRERISYYYDIPIEKIEIVTNGYREDMFHNNYGKNKIDSVKLKYKITGDYLLYLGTLEPRKNIERLIKAFAQLKRDLSDCHKLVLAGGKGWLYDSIFETVKRLNLEQDVIFTGYVEDKDVPLLMSGALVFCFPSLYEGFGIPPLEAMACGTPVITSNTSSLPEVVGDAAILVDPLSVDSISDALKKVVGDESLRREMSKKGLEQCRKFSWRKSAETLLDIIKM